MNFFFNSSSAASVSQNSPWRSRQAAATLCPRSPPRLRTNQTWKDYPKSTGERSWRELSPPPASTPYRRCIMDPNEIPLSNATDPSKTTNPTPSNQSTNIQDITTTTTLEISTTTTQDQTFESTFTETPSSADTINQNLDCLKTIQN